MKSLSRILLICAAAALVPNVGLAAPSGEGYTYSAERVVTVGDIHGAYGSLVELLLANNIIDAELRWSAGQTHFVSLGDLVDRGPDSRKVIELLMALQVQAEQAGGRVHVLLGNHEAMNLTGDLRNVSQAEYQAFAADPLPASHVPTATDDKPAGYHQHRAAFSKRGRYGAWLLSLPSLIKINDTAFVHGGLPPLVTQFGLAATNQALGQALAELVAVEVVDPVLPVLLDEPGPLWYRGTAACHALIETPVLDAALKRLNVKRVVIGHTPTPNRRVLQRYGGKVLAIDTGMLNAVYRGRAFALELRGGRVTVLDAQGQASKPQRIHSVIADNLDRQAEVLLAGQLADSEPEIADAKTNEYFLSDTTQKRYRFGFVKASQKAAKAAEALWRLDRALGVNMVPLTLARKVGKRWGYFTLATGRWITESERRAQDRVRPNFCGEHNEYQILTAFDVLTRSMLRQPDELSYRVGTWAIRLTGQHASFPRSGRLIDVPAPLVLPPLLQNRLQALTQDSLEQILGDLVNTKAIVSLLQRRDKIIQLSAAEAT